MHACNYEAVPQSNGEGGVSNQGVTEEGDHFQIDRDGGQPGKSGDDPKPEQSIGEGGIFWNHGPPSWAPRRRPGSTSVIFTISDQRLVPLPRLGLQVLVLLRLLTA